MAQAVYEVRGTCSYRRPAADCNPTRDNSDALGQPRWDYLQSNAMNHHISTASIQETTQDWSMVAKRIRRVHNGHARAHKLS